MRALKILSIIAICWTIFCFLMMVAVMPDYVAGTGWGIIAMIFFLGYSITALVITQTNK